MISRFTIHILNHNYDPSPLLESITKQVSSRTENINIILWDDGSDPDYKDILSEIQYRFDFPFLRWELSQKNLGRTAMRQKILHNTKDGWMVSIDSDMIPDPDFIDQMINTLKKPNIIYSGCHYYQDNPPENNFLLHWYYGRKREVPAQSKNPYLHFSTGIYALHSSLAENLYFEDSMQTYGHEDTLFGLLLQEKNIQVLSSPLTAQHAGLSTTEDFIKKQLQSVNNLQIVLAKFPTYRNRLIQWALLLDKIPGIRYLITRNSLKQLCLKILNENPKSLVFLDILKLHGYLRNVNKPSI